MRLVTFKSAGRERVGAILAPTTRRKERVVDLNAAAKAMRRRIGTASRIEAIDDMLGLLEEAPHPNAARLFIEYVASEAGQAVLAAANYIPAHPRVPASIPELKPDAGGFGVFVVPPAMTQQRLREWNEIYRELFQ